MTLNDDVMEKKIAGMKKRRFDIDCIPSVESNFSRCPNGIPGGRYHFCEASLVDAPQVEIATNQEGMISVLVCPRCYSKVRLD